MPMDPYGLDAIVAFERLPFLKSGAFAGGQSSFDRAGGNLDSHSKVHPFLGTDAAGDYIILDVKGAGVVYRIWFTGYETTAYLKVYVNGSFVRRCNLKELFEDHSCAGFAPPLVGRKSGGSYCYLPIPFSQSIRITTNGATLEGLGFYYNIEYQYFAPDSPIADWTGTEDAGRALALWKKANVGADPRSTRDRILVEDRVALAPHSTVSILNLAGPRSITSLKLHLGGRDADVLNAVWLRAWWDNRPDAAVNVPLSAFFAAGHFPAATRPKSLVVGILDDDWLYTYFPMPFARHAHIAVISEFRSPVELHYRIEHEPFTDDASLVGYLTAAYKQQTGVNNRSLLLVDVEGSGHLVGVAASIESPPHPTTPFFFLEGDERIYVDDRRTPTIHGTGMEDFFNAGWYFEAGPFSAPMHGCTVKEIRDGRERVSAYRLYLHDAVPFRKHLRMTLEHGPVNDVPVEAWTLAYYYYQPFVRSFPHDVFDVRIATNERAHLYSIANQQWEGTRTWTFEGDFDRVGVEDEGRAHRGSSEFTISMPRENVSVMLRRMFDQGVTNQQAVVFVDDVRVGIWSKAGGNTYHRWCEDEFVISEVLTRGRRSLRIRLEFLPTDIRSNELSLDWNEFKYWTYALQDAGDARPSLLSPRVPLAAMVAVASRDTDKLEVIVVDDAGALVPAAWDPSAPTWYVWWPVALGTVQPGTPVHMISQSKDWLDAFFTNADREICTASWDVNSPQWRVSTIASRLRPGSGGASPAVPAAAPVTAVCKNANHVDIFVAGSDGRVYTAAWPDESLDHDATANHWVGWWTVPDVEAHPGSSIGATSWMAGKIDVFVTSGRGEVFTGAWEVSSGWRGWRLTDRLESGSFVPDLDPGAPVTAVSRSPNHLDIFVAGKDGFVYTASWEAGAPFWKGWWKLPGIKGRTGSHVGVVSRAPARIDVFVTDAAGEMYTASWAPASPWEGWRLRDRLVAGAPVPAVAPGAPIGAVSRSADHMDIFVVGNDTRIWTAAWEPAFGGPWHGWRPLGH